MTRVVSLPYSLETGCPVPWSSAIENHLHQDYPFLGQDNTDENFVIRRYLETLWLPESLSPLQNLIADLRRVAPNDDDARSSQPHPLHYLLEPLLLPTCAASDKYRTELVEILANGGGAGEQEEMMMWYTWNYEKVSPDVDEEMWKKGWLEKLERRETMIQILLNMLKLSLAGSRPQDKTTTTTKKKNNNNKRSSPPPETDEERLESYMDKIAVWQLTASLDEISTGAGSSQGKTKAERHWTQVFCEDVVEVLFKADLLEQCALLRSKVFPSSPFSDADDSDLDNTIEGQKGSHAPSRTRSLSRNASSIVPTDSNSPDSTRASATLQRIRSRSLSVSLAVDEASQRANYIEPKRQLSREVSMSRSFREKPRPSTAVSTQSSKSTQGDKHGAAGKLQKTKLRDMGITLVAETPVKRKRANSGSQDGPDKLSAPAPAEMATLDSSENPLENVHIGETPSLARRTKSGHKRASASLLDSGVTEPSRKQQSRKESKSTPRSLSGKLQSEFTATFEQTRNNDSNIERNESDGNNDDGWTDENVEDDAFTSSFGSPEVFRLSDSDGPQQRLSQSVNSPNSTANDSALRCIGIEPKARRLSMHMHMEDAHFLEMETPTKKRIRRI